MSRNGKLCARAASATTVLENEGTKQKRNWTDLQARARIHYVNFKAKVKRLNVKDRTLFRAELRDRIRRASVVLHNLANKVDAKTK